MAEIYTLSEDSIRKLGRMLHEQQRELTNLRRRLASVSVRRHEAVYMPAAMGGGMLYLSGQEVDLGAELSEEARLNTTYGSGKGGGVSAAALTRKYTLDAYTEQLEILKRGWWSVQFQADLYETSLPGAFKSMNDTWILHLEVFDDEGAETGVLNGQTKSGEVRFTNGGTSAWWHSFEMAQGTAFVALDVGYRLGLKVQHFYGGTGAAARDELVVSDGILTAHFVCKA